MGKYIDWYLVEMERLLQRDGTRSQVRDLVGEVESHLREATEEKVAIGMEQREAELAAIQEFGSPQEIAQGMVLDVLSEARVTARHLMALAAAIAFSGYFAMWYAMTYSSGLGLLIVGILLVWFTAASMHGRTLAFGKLGKWVALAGVAHLLFSAAWFAPMPTWSNSGSFIAREDIRGARPSLGTNLEEPQHQQALALGRAERASYLDSLVFLAPSVTVWSGLTFLGLLATNRSSHALGRRRARQRPTIVLN